jgi:ribosomal protein S18 acetylase RimI-like enzyme
MNNISIRKATIGDLSDIQHLRKLLFELERSEFDSALNIEWSYEDAGKQTLTDQIEKGNNLALIAESNSKIVGFLTGSTWSEATMKDHQLIGQLENIFVMDDFRGQGIGSELIKKFVGWAKNKGAVRLIIVASHLNKKAIGLYKKMGFVDHTIKLRMDL